MLYVGECMGVPFGSEIWNTLIVSFVLFFIIQNGAYQMVVNILENNFPFHPRDHPVICVLRPPQRTHLLLQETSETLGRVLIGGAVPEKH